MPTYVKKTGGDFILPPAGNHQAVCDDIWDIGMQRGEGKGEEILNHKVIIAWEINELIPSGERTGERFGITKFYTASLHEKSKLFADLVGWRNKPFTTQELERFDLDTVIGANCMLNIVHAPNTAGDVKARIQSIAPLPKGMAKIVQNTKRQDPEWVKELRAKAVTAPLPHDETTVAPDEDLPF